MPKTKLRENSQICLFEETWRFYFIWLPKWSSAKLAWSGEEEDSCGFSHHSLSDFGILSDSSINIRGKHGFTEKS